MIKLFIQGMKDGKSEFDVEDKISGEDKGYPEIDGLVRVTGTLTKIGNRYNVEAIASTEAKLKCDRSLEDYTEEIQGDIAFSFVQDDEKSIDDEDLKVSITEDEKFMIITGQVIENLVLNLPMKRISPKYRDKNIDEIFPEIKPEKEEGDEIDERWSKLKKIKFN
jgi:uncharacterized metal-binding protein YceD (DUF177 family)